MEDGPRPHPGGDGALAVEAYAGSAVRLDDARFAVGIARVVDVSRFPAPLRGVDDSVLGFVSHAEHVRGIKSVRLVLLLARVAPRDADGLSIAQSRLTTTHT